MGVIFSGNRAGDGHQAQGVARLLPGNPHLIPAFPGWGREVGVVLRPGSSGRFPGGRLHPAHEDIQGHGRQQAQDENRGAMVREGPWAGNHLALHWKRRETARPATAKARAMRMPQPLVQGGLGEVAVSGTQESSGCIRARDSRPWGPTTLDAGGWQPGGVSGPVAALLRACRIPPQGPGPPAGAPRSRTLSLTSRQDSRNPGRGRLLKPSLGEGSRSSRSGRISRVWRRGCLRRPGTGPRGRRPLEPVPDGPAPRGDGEGGCQPQQPSAFRSRGFRLRHPPRHRAKAAAAVSAPPRGRPAGQNFPSWIFLRS